MSESEFRTAIKRVGYIGERIEGYVFLKQQCRAIPLYHLHNTRVINHFYTISATE